MKPSAHKPVADPTNFYPHARRANRPEHHAAGAVLHLDPAGRCRPQDPQHPKIHNRKKKIMLKIVLLSAAVAAAFTLATSGTAFADPPASFTDGTYLVGTDMPAGNYVTDGTGSLSGSCYWARLKNDGGSGGEIIKNNVGAGPGRFTSRNGEVVELSLGCTWTLRAGK